MKWVRFLQAGVCVGESAKVANPRIRRARWRHRDGPFRVRHGQHHPEQGAGGLERCAERVDHATRLWPRGLHDPERHGPGRAALSLSSVELGLTHGEPGRFPHGPQLSQRRRRHHRVRLQLVGASPAVRRIRRLERRFTQQPTGRRGLFGPETWKATTRARPTSTTTRCKAP